MSFSTSDLAGIKWSLLACLAALAGALVLFNYSTAFEQQKQQQLKQVKERLTEARNQLASAQSDLENMSAYQAEYDVLAARRIIGSEQRLDWIEGLEKLRTQRLVPSFRYEISPQQAYAPNPPQGSGNFALNLSPMTLQIELLHEEQLLRLFKAINSQMPGWFLLDRCQLSRNESGAPGAALLTAECGGGWFTMKNRNTP